MILDARLPLPYLRGRVCASEGILFSLFGLELVPGVPMQTQSAGGWGDVDLRVPNAKQLMLLPSIVTHCCETISICGPLLAWHTMA